MISRVGTIFTLEQIHSIIILYLKVSITQITFFYVHNILRPYTMNKQKYFLCSKLFVSYCDSYSLCFYSCVLFCNWSRSLDVFFHAVLPNCSLYHGEKGRVLTEGHGITGWVTKEGEQPIRTFLSRPFNAIYD